MDLIILSGAGAEIIPENCQVGRISDIRIYKRIPGHEAGEYVGNFRTAYTFRIYYALIRAILPGSGALPVRG